MFKPNSRRKGSGEIRKLSDLFEKYKNNLVAPQASVINVFCEVVDELLGIKIRKDQVKYTLYNKTLSISSAGPLKSEIKIHEAEILIHIKGRLGDKNAPEKIL